MKTVDLGVKPYNLSSDDIKWVENTLESLSLREKVGQMFCAVFSGSSSEDLKGLYDDIPFGGVTFRPNNADVIKGFSDVIQNHARIPCLISSNLESGGSGLVSDGTEFASQLEVAATGDSGYAYKLGDICGKEGSCVGGNYAFAPVVDIMYNWRNPIVNTRTYGDDPEKVLRYALEYMKGIMQHGYAVAVKHFPGDGVDERDQHLLSSVNSLGVDEWRSSFGYVYRGLIEEGAQTVMVGHILLPSFSRLLKPGIRDCEIKPASISYEITTTLLKQELGFNGVAITDSASMTGLGCSLPRRDIPAACINAGCDVFLFGRNAREDFENLLQDAVKGVVPIERIDDAVRRVLGLKASLGLHLKKEFTSMDYKKIVGCNEHIEASRQCAYEAITLVKDTQKLLPLKPEEHRRIWLCVLGDIPCFRGGVECRGMFSRALSKAGFEVETLDVFDYSTMSVAELKKEHDLIIYVANTVSGGNNTVNRISWAPFSCGESPQMVNDIPTMFVSVGSPYHFVDVPMIKTIVNCYNCSQVIVDSVVDKMVGKSPFKGKSPVDPFCGMWGAEF